ncbi:SDR family oxidoreductase [Amycolatopsis orientalis]|uniref:SDR family oxidoreductase n=1 Tax=Amycolatopsis orientalis TaxID=31958 RepID=UPI003AAD97D6
MSWSAACPQASITGDSCGAELPVDHCGAASTAITSHDAPSPRRRQDPFGAGEVLANGYCQSKWVAENVVRVARNPGPPVSVYRLDTISGARTTAPPRPAISSGMLSRT